MAGNYPTPTQRALLRVADVATRMATEDEWVPGRDVSLFRALRELHRCMGHEDERYDPRRLVRAILFHGLKEHISWTEAGVFAPTRKERKCKS